MTIYKRNSTKKEQLAQSRDIIEDPNAKPYSVKTANNALMKNILDQANQLPIPKKLIKTKNNGDISLQLIANLSATGRTKEVIAKTLGMTSRNFRYLCEEHPEIESAMNMGSALLGGQAIDIMWGKIYNDEDKNNGLLKIALEEYAGVGKKSIKVEHTGADGEDIQVNINTRHKSIMSKIFQKEDLDAIEGEFQEVDDRED